MKRMGSVLRKRGAAPLPLKKPAHIDDEAALWKSTVVSKKFGSRPNIGKFRSRPVHLIGNGIPPTTL
jgi:hypothetical protein